ncbi:MAG: zinc ribbon domain-containing protein [Proteobacteria bacterium]|nr:zinc ribbon domain-containing protein [Pseudomonadota bacterium]
MAGTEAAGSGFCVQCGTALQGKFCSGCGAAAPIHSGQEGWSALTSEFLSSRRGKGIFAVAISFLVSPVNTIIRLTDDPTYRSHWGFLTATVGAQLTLAYVIMPRFFSALFDVPNTANSGAVIANEAVQYVGMAILTPIQYYICRALGTLPRSPMSYVKLCVLSVSYGALLSIAISLTALTIALAVVKTGANIDLQEVAQALTMFGFAAILAFVAASHKRFWGMSWPIAIGVTLFLGAMSWLVVYPGLTALVEQAKIGEMFGKLFG